MNKEIFSSDNFIQEEIYRMNQYMNDNSMCLFYRGDPENAPPSALYVYKPVKSVYKIHTGDRVTIKDGLNMPLDSFTLLGWSYVHGEHPTPTEPSIITVVAPQYNFTVTDGVNVLYIETLQPLCAITEQVRDYYQDGYVYYNTSFHRLEPEWVWLNDYTHTTNNIFVVKLLLLDGNPNQNLMMSTHFTAADDLSQSGNMMIKNGYLYLAFDKNMVNSLLEFKIWLASHAVYIVYERDAVRKIKATDCNLSTHDGDTIISNDTEAEMLISYRVLPNARIWERQPDGTLLELQNYYISFETGGKTYGLSTVSVEMGRSIILPTISTEHWDFGGWYVPSLGETIVGEFTPTQDETLIAQWIEK